MIDEPDTRLKTQDTRKLSMVRPFDFAQGGQAHHRNQKTKISDFQRVKAINKASEDQMSNTMMVML